MQIETKLRRAGKSLAQLSLVAALFGVPAVSRAQLPPANDNLTNAQPIQGVSGSITGNNQLATTQTGEPAPVAGTNSGASIWYLWTAPMSNYMSFDTRNSTDPYGHTLQTVMAVYAKPPNISLSNLTFAQLNAGKVAGNGDDPYAPTLNQAGVSRVNFNANPGTTYLIQLEGRISGGVTNEGYIVLNWHPAVGGGLVSFATNLYNFGQLDNIPMGEVALNPGTQTNLGTTAYFGEGRVTLNRTTAYNGRILVDMSVASDVYRNIYTTNAWITNIYIGPSDATGTIEMPGASTNIIIASTNFVFTLGYDVLGVSTSYNVLLFSQGIISNAYGSPTFFYLTNICNTNMLDPGNLGVLPPAVATNTTTTTVGTNTVTNYTYVTMLTNVTAPAPQSLSFLTPSAIDGVDFYSSDFQTVIFDDYQMSSDAFVNVAPNSLFTLATIDLASIGSGGPDWPDRFGNLVAPGIPRRVILTLSNARLDPLESQDVAAPTLAPNEVFPDGTGAIAGGGFLAGNTSVAVMPIQDFYNIKPGVVAGMPNTCTNYDAINFENRVYRFLKPQQRTHADFPIPAISVTVWRLGPTDHATPLNYTVNGLNGNPQVWALPTSQELGADYAIGQLILPSPQPPGNFLTLENDDFRSPYGPTGSGSITIPAVNPPGYGAVGVGITIPVNNNGAVEFDRQIQITLTKPGGGDVRDVLGGASICSAIIQFDQNLTDWSGNHTQQQPGGAADRSWNMENVANSYPPFNSLPGADQEVEAIAIQPDGKAVIGGHFAAYDATNFNYLVRTLTNGLPDFSFNSGVGIIGPNDFVAAVAIDPSGRILIGGAFTSFNGVTANHIARLNVDGSLDTTFNTGRGAGDQSGNPAGATVWALAVDAGGNVLIGGDFLTFNATNRMHVARLIGSGPNAGSLDTSFDPGAGPDQDVRAIASDSLTNVIIGGPFATVSGTNWSGLARLLPSGALDTNFNPGADVNGPVYSIAVQSPGNQIVIGGSFSQVNLTNLNCIARLKYNGTVDNSFSPGAGANGPVHCVAIQPDQKILLGGQFSSVGSVRRVGYARLLPNGWVDTSFLDVSYNQFAGVINHYYNPYAVNPNDLPIPTQYNTPNYVNAMAYQPLNQNIMIGGSFARLGGGYTRDDYNIRWNVASVIGPPTLGPQGTNLLPFGIENPNSGPTAPNYPGNVGFTQSTYSANDTANSTFISMVRTNGGLGYVNVVMASNSLPPGPGAASALDYGLINNGIAQYPHTFTSWISLSGGGITTPGYGYDNADGAYGPNYSTFLGGGVVPLQLSIFDNRAAQQNLFAGLSILSINDYDTFSLGGMNIPMLPAPAFTLANLEIINDNFPAGTLGFSATNYNVVESGGAITITVLRTNGSYGSVSVNYRTQNGFTNDPGVQTALGTPAPNADYVTTSGTLNFADGALSATFQVQILNHSTLQSNKFFNVILSNPTHGAGFDTNNPPLLVTNTVVTIVDNHFQPGHLSFTSTAYSTTKGDTAVIGVERTGGALGIISVQCLTLDGSGSNGINYTTVSNTLQWNDSDVANKYVYVPTLEDHIVEGTKTVNLVLSNAIVANNGTGAPTNSLVLIYPTNAVLSILDDDLYGQLNFAPTNINVLQNAGQALVTVARTHGTVGTETVNFATANGSGLIPPLQPALAGTNYGATNGTLTFADGVTSQTFTVPIYYTPAETNIANRVINITLSNPNPAAITAEDPIPYPKTGTIKILDNQLVTGAPGSVDTTLLTGIGFNDVVNSISLQPDGKVLAGGAFTFVGPYPLNQAARLNGDGSVDTGFLYLQPGSDGLVQTILSQSPDAGQTNGSIMVAGTFAHFDSIPRNNIARLNLDGSVDETFNPGAGADNTIYAVVETKLAPTTNNGPLVRAYIIGGSFANFNGVQRNGVARITSAGQVDLNFNPGNGVTSTNGAVHALAVQGDGKVIAGGDFTTFNNVIHNHLVRLNLDGSLDATFNPGTDPSVQGSVHAILIQPNGQIIIGGVFTTVNGVNMNHIARLNSDGTLDATFNPGVGANNTVEALAVDSQGRILLGGQFTRASGVTRNAVTRLNPDGTVDPDINFGAGANGYVHALAVDANDEIDVGGSFTSFGGYVQNNFTRLFGGEISGPGTLNFVQAVFGVLGNQTNAVITIQRSGGTGNANFPVVSAIFATADGTALNGVDYTGLTNTVSFPIGETFTNVSVPIINNGVVGNNKFLNLSLSSPAGASLGFQNNAILVITNANSAVAFSSASYRQTENAPGGAAVIPVVRIGNPYATLSVTAFTGTNGTATPGVNYFPASNVLVFAPGVMTNLWVIGLSNNTSMMSDLTVDLELSNPTNGFLTTPSSAILTIATVYAGPGVITFDQPSYTVSESGTNAVINVLRTNGVTGPISVTFATSNGTATAGVNYDAVVQVLNFSDGQSSQSVSIPIIQQTNAMPDTTVYLMLTNPVGTTIAGSSLEILTIQNDIQNFTVGSADYFVSEGSGSVTVSILRNGPSNGTVSVGYTTVSPTNAYGTNGFAIPGVNYGPTNGVLRFVQGQTFETVPIAIYQQNTVDAPETFQVVLTNASAGTQIGSPGAAVVTIIGDVTGFEMATNAFETSTNTFLPVEGGSNQVVTYTVGENSSNVVVTVNRLNVNTGTVSVNFATSDGTAVAGVDYVKTNGTLTFADGQGSTNVTLTILDPNVLENNNGRSFGFSLSRPFSPISTNCYVLAPSNAVIIITNTVTGISFSSAAYAVSECGVQAQITVVLNGVTNTNSSVQFMTSDGTGHAGTNYFPTNGTLNFAPGVTSQTFSVDVINNHIIAADHTVLLTLLNPEGGAVLTQPSSATLTIQECNGAYIVAAGTLLTYESFHPTNGLIDPGETVTVDFALRDIAGGNTTNLVATLQTNSGVTPIAPNAQNYGALVQGGHVVFEPYSFTASGTNNQVISTVFQLQDGPRNLGTVAFAFTLGATTTTFSNTNFILLTNLPSYGFNPTPGAPYPSTINVSGSGGSVGKVTVTISNFTHSLPSDIEAVLVSPGGTNVLLFNDVGGDNGKGATNFSVTFDDSAATYLSSNQLPSGVSTTNKPTPYLEDNSQTIFVGYNTWGLLPVMPSPAPANPYAINLSAFSGTPANGTWSLYMADTQVLDYGAISNGWSLSLSTGAPVPSYSDLELAVVPAPAAATVGNTLVYNVALTNYGPAPATHVFITNTLPSGLTYLSNNFPVPGTNIPPWMNIYTNGVLTVSTNFLAVGAGFAFNIFVTPNAAETVTNTVIAIADQLESSTNNATNVITTVTLPSADLGVTLNGTPNPVTAGDFVTFTVVVTNNGPSLASATEVTNYLPAGLTLTSSNLPLATTLSNSAGTIVWSVGSLAAFTNATLTLTTKATNVIGATVTDIVLVGSPVYDPIKLNNFASFKIVINPAPTLGIVSGAHANTFTWPAAATNFVLQGATNLTPPIVWVTVTNAVTTNASGQYSVTVPTNSLHFFKLTTPF